jgi:hypothetical protein
MAGSLKTPQRGLLAGSQAGPASQLTTDQYEISAELQEVQVESATRLCCASERHAV